jgi:hypothetical protein
MGRSILAILLGAVLAGVVIFAVESAGHLVYPPPEGLDFSDREAVRVFIAEAPAGALLLVLVAWAVGTFAGAWLAAWIAKRAQVLHALIIGVLFLAGAVVNMLMIPHPLWFWIPGVLLFLPSAAMGGLLAGGGKRA